MTLPDERYRAVAAARELLVEIANPAGRWKRIPKELKLHCIHVLRHYPTGYDMTVAARYAPDVFQMQMEPVYRMIKKFEQSKAENNEN